MLLFCPRTSYVARSQQGETCCGQQSGCCPLLPGPLCVRLLTGLHQPCFGGRQFFNHICRVAEVIKCTTGAWSTFESPLKYPPLYGNLDGTQEGQSEVPKPSERMTARLKQIDNTWALSVNEDRFSKWLNRHEAWRTAFFLVGLLSLLLKISYIQTFYT